MSGIIVKEIVASWLLANGYDGLMADPLCGECGCCVEDYEFMPCDLPQGNCIPAYKVPCDGSCDNDICDYHMVEERPKK